MKMTVEIDIGAQLDEIALSQFLHWAQKLQGGVEFSATQVAAAEQVVRTVAPPAAPVEIGSKANGSEAVVEPESEVEIEEVEQPQTHAVPPGVAAPKRRGRPPKAKVEEVTASVPTSIPVSIGGSPVSTTTFAAPAGAAIPPGVTATPVAMPPAVESGGTSLEDLRAAIAAANAHDNKIAFNIMRTDRWADGSPKPKWFNASQVPAEECGRLIDELMAATPQ
jgi:hypothetical protein